MTGESARTAASRPETTAAVASLCASYWLMVNEETPTSYRPEPTPAMIESNGAVSNCASRPSFCATSSNRSTSKPMIVWPSSARNSLGAYVLSLPTVITPSSATAGGTRAASASSAATLGSGSLVAAAPPAPVLPPAPLSPESPPQPARTRVRPATAATAARPRRVRDRSTTGSPSTGPRGRRGTGCRSCLCAPGTARPGCPHGAAVAPVTASGRPPSSAAAEPGSPWPGPAGSSAPWPSAAVPSTPRPARSPPSATGRAWGPGGGASSGRSWWVRRAGSGPAAGPGGRARRARRTAAPGRRSRCGRGRGGAAPPSTSGAARVAARCSPTARGSARRGHWSPGWSPGAVRGGGEPTGRRARRRRRDVEAGPPEGLDDAGAQVAADLELLAGQRAGHHPDVDLLEVERLHTHHAGRVEQQRAQPLVAEGLRADLLEDVVDPADVHRRRHRDVDDRARPVAGEVDDLHDLPVGQGDHLAVGGAQPGDPQRDVLDRALGRVAAADHRDGDDVAEAVLPLGDDEEARQHVADDPLRAEAQPDAQHGRRRHQPADRDARLVQDGEDGDRVDEHDERPGDHLGQRVPVLGGLGAHQGVAAGRPGVDAVGDLRADPRDEPGQQDRPQDEEGDGQPTPGEPGQQWIEQCHRAPASPTDLGSASSGQRGATNRACAERPIRPVASWRSAKHCPAPAGPIVVAASTPSHSPAGGRTRATVRSTLAKGARCQSRAAEMPLAASVITSRGCSGVIGSPSTRGDRARGHAGPGPGAVKRRGT